MITLSNMRKLLIVLIAACFLAIAEHHHDDFDSHDDCPVCALIHSGIHLDDFVPVVTVFWVLLFIVQVQNSSRNLPNFVHHYNPRGPPCIQK